MVSLTRRCGLVVRGIRQMQPIKDSTNNTVSATRLDKQSIYKQTQLNEILREISVLQV